MALKKLRPIRWDKGIVYLLEQRVLPFQEKWVKCDTVEKVAKAIEEMTVRGAPAIGVTAAYGVALGARRSKTSSAQGFKKEVEKAIDRLRQTRPTAVNLFWALDRMKRALEANGQFLVEEQKRSLEKEAIRIHQEDEKLCDRLGEYGSELLIKARHVLTHCNTGALATGGDGTALAGITHAARKNRQLHVWVDETRPYLQGARLTAYELAHAGVRFHLITDNMAASLMKSGKVDAVVVGADRIVTNGDTANKIGTYALAVLAKHHGIPFYVSAPTTTLDLTKKTGAQIEIEQRESREVNCVRGVPITKESYPVYNPAFDVTPGNLITAIILETGICRAPYPQSLLAALKGPRKKSS